MNCRYSVYFCISLIRRIFKQKWYNRPELGEGIRSFPSGNYVIFYRTVEGGIEIMRVLHGARDIEKIFAQDTEFTQGD